jgi:hypothetical protein
MSGCPRLWKRYTSKWLNSDPFNFIERNFIGGAVIELCGPRTLMRGDRLRVLERAAVEQVGSNSGRTEGMAVGGGAQLEYQPGRPGQYSFRLGGLDSGVCCLSYTFHNLWFLGFHDQSLKRGNEAVALAQALPHPDSLNFAEGFVGPLHLFRREALAA